MVRYNWKHHPSQPSVPFYVQQYNSDIEFLTQSIQQINCFVYSLFLYQPFGLLEQFCWGRHFSTLVPIIKTLYLRSGSKVIIQYACAKLEHPPTLSPAHFEPHPPIPVVLQRAITDIQFGRATSTMQWISVAFESFVFNTESHGTRNSSSANVERRDYVLHVSLYRTWKMLMQLKSTVLACMALFHDIS